MYLSSYSSYIAPSNSQKVADTKLEKSKLQTTSFLSHLSKEDIKAEKNTTSLALELGSKNQALANRYKLQEQMQSNDIVSFTKKNLLQNAKTAYEDNSKMFSLWVEPKGTIAQAPKADSNMKAINIYLENDRYHRITA